MKGMTTRYSRLMIVIHWSTAVVLLLAYLLSEGGPGVRTDPPRWHFICGTTVVLLVIPRVVARALGNAPPLHYELVAWVPSLCPRICSPSLNATLPLIHLSSEIAFLYTNRS